LVSATRAAPRTISLSAVQQAALAGVGTWFLTALGATPVLFFRAAPRRLMDALMGFAGGVMVAASCWSLLIPAIELSGPGTAIAGLLAGAAVIWVLDRVVPHLHPEFPDEATPEGPRVAWQRSVLLTTAITLHNIPEGLAVGIAFGGGDTGAAMALALGIGLQNVPEGLAVALPLRRDGMSRWKALWYGQLSAAVEPVAALLGAVIVVQVRGVLPFGLAAAAGAMLFVVVEELIPETTRSGNVDVATGGFIAGFATMMGLDTLFA
jgi:ZIP family zinc transporter